MFTEQKLEDWQDKKNKLRQYYLLEYSRVEANNSEVKSVQKSSRTFIQG